MPRSEISFTLHQSFEQQVRQCPQAIAATCGSLQLTYYELNCRANHLARQIHRYAGNGEGLIGLCAARSLDLIVGMLAILKAGRGYVPLDPAYPRERLSFMLHDAAAPILLVQGAYASTFPGYDGTVIVLDAVAEGDDEELESSGAPDALAYVMYTSGSTGTPKGVAVSHHNVLRLFAATKDLFGFRADDVWTLFHSYAFDFSVWEIWGALLHGGRLVIVPHATSRAPAAFWDLIRSERVTVLNQTPSAFRQLLQADAARPAERLETLRYVVFGGEALEFSSLCPWIERYGDAAPQLVNMYGITETTVHVTHRLIQQTDLNEKRSLIGAPLADLELHLLGPDMQPTADGETGEIYVGGAGLARGYWNRPELTATRFVNGPFLPSVRLYRSGDLARRSPDGELEYLGRSDEQVKLRGYRIEPGEIAAALRAHPQIQDAAVVLREDTPGDLRLAGYLVTWDVIPVAALHGFLAARLPEHMIPSDLISLTALPLTANGKLDRSALPPPRSVSDCTAILPRTSKEEELAAICRAVLGGDVIGVHDNLLLRGASSLHIMQIRARLQAGGLELPVHAFFTAPTIAELAPQLSSRAAAGPVASVPSAGWQPLSYAQEQIWLAQQLAPASDIYHCAVAFRLRGPVDAGRLERSLRELVRRHDALRTIFTAEDGRPLQRVLSGSLIALEEVQLPGGISAAGESELNAYVGAAIVRPFELTQGPLLRAILLRNAAAECVLLLVVHHIITDGWSLHRCVSELATLYATDALIEREVLADEPSGVTYADYVRWQRHQLESGALASQRAYWLQQLAGAPQLLDLPFARPHAVAPTFQGASVALPIEIGTITLLRGLGSPLGATVNMGLLAAFCALLFRYTGQEDLLVGLPRADRARPEFGTVQGLFVNLLLIRADLHGDPDFETLLRRIGSTCRDAYTNGDYPFAQLVQELCPAREPSRHPLVQVVCAPQIAPRPALTLPELSSVPLPLRSERSPYDLTLYLWPGDEKWEATLEYNAEQFSHSAIIRVAAHFSTLLHAALAAPKCPLSTLPMLSEGELEQILVDWNRTARPLPAGRCAHDLIVAQAQRTPAALAVRGADQTLTYVELEQRANQLAHYLQAQSIAPGGRVALCMERSSESIVALLGILKAGLIYVPLDSDYPPARLRSLLVDSEVAVVLTRTALAPRLGVGTTVVCLDAEVKALAACPMTPPAIVVDPDHTAYILYTSGSTGQPKGVLVLHRGLLNLALAQQQAFAAGPGTAVLQFAALGFDASIWEVFLALTSGATLCVPADEVRLDGRALLDYLQTQKIGIATLPPAVLAHLPPAALPALRHLIVAGEECPAALVERWAAGRCFTNAYGPTETTVCATMTTCVVGSDARRIGRPLPNVRIYILDKAGAPVSIGIPGELCVGGLAVARGYLNRPELSAQRFVSDPFANRCGEPPGTMYRTGDLARWSEDGQIEFLGRLDRQVKIRGCRVELGEVEAALCAHPLVAEAAAAAWPQGTGEQKLVAYVVLTTNTKIPTARELSGHLQSRLPRFMVPASFMIIEALPLAQNGKLDYGALPVPQPMSAMAIEPTSASPDAPLQEQLADIWRDVLRLDEIGPDEPFFDLGGHSLLLAQVRAAIATRIGIDVALLTLLQHATLRQLATYLEAQRRVESKTPPVRRADETERRAATEAAAGVTSPADARQIAIIGMAGRFPGAPSPGELWTNLLAGVETISHFSRDALIAEGASVARVRNPHFVPAEGVLQEADCFDAAFFGYSPQDALLMDPQQRLFLESCWAALEDAGYAAGGPGSVGVFGSAGMPRHWLFLPAARDAESEREQYRAMLLNSRDFLASRVAYKLGLRGPAVNVQSGCSSSLLAVHLACQSLRQGECELALAGGAALQSLDAAEYGHLHDPGGILSPDGHCRPFDAAAQGTVKGSGVGVVVLKRLGDALADGDTIYAVVLGSAANNDGGNKPGFTAPSLHGQSAVIERAHLDAGVRPESISFVEAHGTATQLGDPVEVAALTHVFAARTPLRHWCALGSIKGNLGHLDAAAGIAGLIKAALALQHATIPPTLHFQQPNPQLDLAQGPFFVNQQPLAWPHQEGKRRAGVTSLGMGGTNVHVVLEEPPVSPRPLSQSQWCLIPLSAPNPGALERLTARLSSALEKAPELDLDDVAYTLQVGRRVFSQRRVVLCSSSAEVRAALNDTAAKNTWTSDADFAEKPAIAFAFPGQGAQHPGMAQALYERFPDFRLEVARCLALLPASEQQDLQRALLATPDASAAVRLQETSLTQPALFIIEYALAKLLESFGVVPQVMIGHSIGEYVAACLAGVFTLGDALALVAERGRLVQSLPAGAMLTVRIDAPDLRPFLGGELSIAVDAPGRTTVAGPVAAIESLQALLSDRGVAWRRLRTSHAFHSWMMEPALSTFEACVRTFPLASPKIPFISNVSGTWINDTEATNPSYWVAQLRQTVQLGAALGTLLQNERRIVLEVGPGHTLGSLLKRHPEHRVAQLILPTLAGEQAARSTDVQALLAVLAALWCRGVELDWRPLTAGKRRRVHLPSYPFLRRRFAGSLCPAEQRAASSVLGLPAVSTAELQLPGCFPSERLETAAERITRYEADIASHLNIRAIDSYPALRQRLNQLAASWIYEFFTQRLIVRRGACFDIAGLSTQFQIIPALQPLYRFFLRILSEDGLVRVRNGVVEFLVEPSEVPQADGLLQAARRDYPEFGGLLRFLAHCVSNYGAALTGKDAPISVLYPNGTDAFYQECRRETAEYLSERVYLELLRKVILDRRAKNVGKRWRILEIGAGHGQLTWSLLPLLQDASVEYHFTDIGRSFLQRARSRATELGLVDMHFSTFDLDAPPEPQGLQPGGYDVILGFNALHVVANVEQAAANLKRLLAKDGCLMLVEATQLSRWDHLSWGLIPGWWNFAGELRTDSLLLNLAGWETVLHKAGFRKVLAFPQESSARAAADHGLVLAEVPEPTTDRMLGLPAPAPLVSRTTASERTQPLPGTDDLLRGSLRALWLQSLGMEQLRDDEDYFALGGDSLGVVHLISQMREQLGRTLTMAEFVSTPTLRGVLAHLQSPPESPPAEKFIALQPDGSACSFRGIEPGELEVRACLRDFADRTARRDQQLVDQLFARDARIVIFDTCDEELHGYASTRNFFSQEFAAASSVEVKMYDETVRLMAGGQACFATARWDCTVVAARTRQRLRFSKVRLSWVLEQQAGQWKILHVHYSLPFGRPLHSQ